MCGIVGLLNCGNVETLDKMLNVLSHRGPDDVGTKWFDGLNSGIGHRRLSIIDLSMSGHQPMKNENERLWITFNGEIYNFKEIKKELLIKGYNFHSNSDTEVLLKAYEEWGSKCLNKLNGMFAFAIYNITKNKLPVV